MIELKCNFKSDYCCRVGITNERFIIKLRLGHFSCNLTSVEFIRDLLFPLLDMEVERFHEYNSSRFPGDIYFYGIKMNSYSDRFHSQDELIGKLKSLINESCI